MHKIYLFSLLVIALVLSACASGLPNRNHNAVAIPRYVDWDPGAIRSEKKLAIGAAGGANYGIAVSDSGDTSGSINIFTGPILRRGIFSGGWMPFYANSRVTKEDTTNLGSLLFLGVKALNKEKWKMSVQTSYAVASNHTTDNGGCEYVLFSFGTNKCETAYADVNSKIKELGLTMVVSKDIGSKEFLSLSTSYYRTLFNASNSYTLDPSHDTQIKGANNNFAANLFYSSSFGNEEVASILVGAGASSNKEFRTGGKRKVIPQFDVRIIF